MKICPQHPEYFRYHAKGKVRYGRHHNEGGHGWIVIDCPFDIALYYNRVCRWLLHNERISLPYHGAHITVVAGKYTQIDEKLKWGFMDGAWVDFWYGPVQDNGEDYYWLPVHCPSAEKIRLNYGLTPTPKFQYHLTVGYKQEIAETKKNLERLGK
jgi:hypothetical protein